jgi:hypothetical protein
MQQPMAPQQHSASAMPAAPRKKKLSSSQFVAAALLFGVAILATLVLVFMVVGGSKGLESAVKKSQYQAVFLSSQDGQVYFGKLTSYNQQYYRLTDIFYVRVENKIQPEGQAQATSTAAQQSISLAKLGNELHGPEDEMFISKDKVLFWENLKDDGQVVKAISEYKKNPAAATKNNATSTTTDTTTGTTGTGTTSGTGTTTTPPTTKK